MLRHGSPSRLIQFNTMQWKTVLSLFFTIIWESHASQEVSPCRWTDFMGFGVQRLEGLQRHKQVDIICRTVVSWVRPSLIGWYSEACVSEWIYPWWALSLVTFQRKALALIIWLKKVCSLEWAIIDQLNGFRMDSDSCLFPWLQTTPSFSKFMGTALFSTCLTIETPQDFHLHENRNMISVALLNAISSSNITDILTP